MIIKKKPLLNVVEFMQAKQFFPPAILFFAFLLCRLIVNRSIFKSSLVNDL